MDTIVMPTCAVERKRSGSFISLRAACALRLPSFAITSMRLFLAEMSDTSAREKNPLKKMRINITSMSTISPPLYLTTTTRYLLTLQKAVGLEMRSV